jgi:Ni/Co efflux regulator RcnB
MKRTFMGAVTIIALLAPMAVAPTFSNAAAAVQAGVQYDRNDRNNRENDGRGDDHGNNNDRQNGDGRGYSDNRTYDNGRWNDSEHNGYRYKGRWHYGPPPSNYEGRGVKVGHHDWRRGQRLPSYYRERYQEVDYRDRGWREPPRGYHYVRDDRGEVLLVAIATGVILSVILSSH